MSYDRYLILFRLIKYGLDDEADSVANYLILSLQTDQIVPSTQEIIWSFFTHNSVEAEHIKCHFANWSNIF